MPAPRHVVIAIAILLLAPATLLGAAEQAKNKSAVAEAAPRAKPATGGMMGVGLPHYVEPASYSVDLVIRAEGKDFTMKRFIDAGRIRSEIKADGQDMIMIEAGDEQGTTYMLMPGEKRAIKQSRTAMMKMMPKDAAKEAEEPAPGTPAADMKVEDLGDETLDGRAVKKVRFHVTEGEALGWFDKTSGAPVRMESEAQGQKTAMEWKNYTPGPQAAKLFEVPKGYDVMDMDEMMAKMKTMQGQPGMGAMMQGMGGMGGGMGGMAKGMAGNMAQNFGSSMGGSFGSALGGALGGPLGAIAGQYIGGKVGGLIAKKTTDAVIPGK